MHSLCHFDGKVLVGNGVVPRHVLSDDRVEEELTDGGDLLQCRVVGQINGDAREEEVNQRDYRVEDEEGEGVIEKGFVVLLLCAIYAGQWKSGWW